MHALNGRQCIHVLARGGRHLVELVVAVAVEQAESSPSLPLTLITSCFLPSMVVSKRALT